MVDPIREDTVGLESFIIGGEHGVVRFYDLRIWAARGLIHIEDGRDNSYKQLSVRQALERVQGFNDMLGKKSDDKENKSFMPLRERIQEFVEKMMPVIRKAQEQGMPDDPTYHPQKPARVAVPLLDF